MNSVKETDFERVGRNDACPCGSGKKYKKCHLGTYVAEQRRDAGPTEIHALDNDLVEQMLRFALHRFGARWTAEHERVGFDSGRFQLSVPWSVYVQSVDGRPVVEWFLAEQGRYLEREALAWIGAECKAWLSVWEAVEVEPGVRGRFVDRLTGEERTVEESLGTSNMTARTNVLARVVDADGFAVFSGMHPLPLAPFFADRVIRRMKAHVRRTGAIPRDQLRSDAVFRKIVTAWDEACDAQAANARRVPKLRNSDREKLVLVDDVFEFDPTDRGEIVDRLAARQGAEHERRGDEDVISISKRAVNQQSLFDRNTVATITIREGSLLGFANSRERADRLRRRIERACSGLVRFRDRTEIDARDEMKRLRSADAGGEVGAGVSIGREEALGREEAGAVMVVKERHYREWPDCPLPALGGMTPREAMGTANGRRQLDLVLREMEFHEQRGGTEPKYDFSILRRELGLTS